MTWLRREIEISQFLPRELVTRPTSEPGPFEHGGYVISLWEPETIVGAPEPNAGGAALARIHQLLKGYDHLPLWGGFEEARQIRDRARQALSSEEEAMFDRAWDKAECIVEGARARSASFQAIHGDAHIRNVLQTERGTLWTDWEDAFLGPIEFDIACLRSRLEIFGEERDAIEAMTSAYAATSEYNRELTADLGIVRNVQVIPWLVIFSERDPELLPRMRARLAWAAR